MSAMKHVVYTLTKLFPYWALPLSLIFFDLVVFFRRRGQSKQQRFFFVIAVFLMIMIGVWVVFRGDLHSDRWVHHFMGE